MRALIIWGCGGHAREVNMLCEQLALQVVGFLDERLEMKGSIVDGVPVLGTLDDIRSLRDGVGILSAGVGDPALRRRLAAATAAAGFRSPDPIIHPGTRLSRLSSVGPGSVVCAGAVITVNVRVGSHVIINNNSTLGHDVTVGDFVTVSPGVNVSGNVTIEDGVYVGTNAAIRERVHIGAGAVVAGGAFVREDVPSQVLVAGVPATIKKHLK
jgi:sugar O-acyltransferase (sialic acid O-acetyltransferase NeuD family)